MMTADKSYQKGQIDALLKVIQRLNDWATFDTRNETVKATEYGEIIFDNFYKGRQSFRTDLTEEVLLMIGNIISDEE